MSFFSGGGAKPDIIIDGVAKGKVNNLTLTAGSNISLASLSSGLNNLDLEITISGVNPYSDEQAQDAVGSILTDTSTIDFTYNDAGNSITASVIEAGLTLSNLGGTLSIAKGGTGQTTANASLNALLPLQTGNSGKVLSTDGSNTSWITTSGGLTDTDGLTEGTTNKYFTDERAQDAVGTILTDSSTIDFTYNDAGNSITATVIQSGITITNLSGTLPISSTSGTLAINRGGTGQTTANAALNALLPTQTSNANKFLQTNATDTAWTTVDKTFVGLGSVENTALSTWAGTTNLTTLGTIATGAWSATTIAVNKGGTGQTSYTDGQLLIGNTTGNTLAKATLTAGSSRLSITNGSGSITLDVSQGNLSLGSLGGALNLSSQVTGSVLIANGGTGQTTYTDGQLLIGNSTGNTLTKATLTGGTGLTVTNGGGSITVGITNSGVGTTQIASNAVTEAKLVTGLIGAGLVILEDQKSSGTNGGGSTGGSFQTRTLNTKVVDTSSICTLSSNQFQLPAGTYRVFASAPAVNVNGHQLKIRNVTDSTDAVLGTVEYSISTTQTTALLEGRFTIAGTKTFELQHYTANTSATTGLGTGISSGVTNVFARVVIMKET